ncbi:DUF92 domain-containing protein [Bacillus sp. AK128]
MNNVLFVFLFIMVVSLMGYRIKSLTISGAIAAFMVGCLVSIGFGINGLLLLGVFFLTSSLWSKYKRNAKKSMDEITEKGETRDFTQVLANGLVPALCGLFNWLYPLDYLLIAFIISIAAANADTWASELGSLSKKNPVHVLQMKRVNPGTSGAVSTLGIIASILGAGVIAGTSFFLYPVSLFTLLIIIGLGTIGSLFDTIIGATIQAKYRCASCNVLTEKRVHCGTSTYLERGWRLVNNEVTNLASILAATALGVMVYFLYH